MFFSVYIAFWLCDTCFFQFPLLKCSFYVNFFNAHVIDYIFLSKSLSDQSGFITLFFFFEFVIIVLKVHFDRINLIPCVGLGGGSIKDQLSFSLREFIAICAAFIQFCFSTGFSMFNISFQHLGS